MPVNNNEIVIYRYIAYTNHDNYINNFPYFKKDFLNHAEMKVFIAKYSKGKKLINVCENIKAVVVSRFQIQL